MVYMIWHHWNTTGKYGVARRRSTLQCYESIYMLQFTQVAIAGSIQQRLLPVTFNVPGVQSL
jgi:hypothetical protein